VCTPREQLHDLLLRLLSILVAHDRLLLLLLALHPPLPRGLALDTAGLEVGPDLLLTSGLGLRGVDLNKVLVCIAKMVMSLSLRCNVRAR